MIHAQQLCVKAPFFHTPTAPVVPRITPWFTDFLERLTELRKSFYSWLWFITVKEYKARSIKEKGTRDQVWEDLARASRSPLPMELYKDRLIPLAATAAICVKCCLSRESLLEPKGLEVLMKFGHTGTYYCLYN